jgi:hypothetical protein
MALYLSLQREVYLVIAHNAAGFDKTGVEDIMHPKLSIESTFFVTLTGKLQLQPSV